MVENGTKLANGRQFTDLSITVDGKKRTRCRTASASTSTATSGRRRLAGPGIDGVQVFSPEGERIGQILLPERCANVCFGGPKRNRLFMAASQSLYARVREHARRTLLLTAASDAGETARCVR